jgi:hypothetical protein
MALTSAQVAVGATETALNAVDVDDYTHLTVKNTHATELMYVGPTGVTTANGFILSGGATITVEVEPGDVLYGIRGGTAVTAAVLRSV